jgi:probable HAF family extracellular repeat protein
LDIGPPGSYQASAIAINNNGQILGNAFFTSGGGGSFIYANGKFSYLTSPPGSPVGGAYAMNSLGEVVGEVESSAGTAHAAAYSNGMWVDLGGVTGAGFHATGINTAGQIIATAFYPVQSYHPFRPGKHVAYIIGASGPVNLNTRIPANSGYTLTDFIAINDNGQILCDASTRGPGGGRGRGGGRTNEAWADQKIGFYYAVVGEMVKQGFAAEEISKIGGGNFCRTFDAATSSHSD